MNCPNCQNTNPDGARFCMNCGSALSAACPNCSTSLPAGAKFCFNCGYQLAVKEQPLQEKEPGFQQPARPTAPAVPPASPEKRLEQFIPRELLSKLEAARSSGSIEGERRVVTMLFCDVKGSTAAAGLLDPEEWAEIINGAFAHMIRPIYHYEGTVARLMGDGLLAFFGAPIAHEDDPQRAVLAGMEIVEAIRAYRQEVARQWSIDLDVRVGINTGLVVVGAVGSDLRMEYTALGDAINMAARMEQTAQPGTVQVAEATYRLVAPLFDFEVLESVEVKGKNDPVRAYRLTGQKAEPGRLRGIPGLRAALVGRRSEMESLQEAAAKLLQGRGVIVSLMGEAGLGKSRLIAELRQAVSQSPLYWFEGRSRSFETSTPYAPFAVLFADILDLHGGQMDYAVIKEKLASRFPHTTGIGAPFIAALLGLTPEGADLEQVKYLEPPHLRSLVFANAASVFQELAAEKPLVLVLDDLHWIDPTSLELLESLLPLTERTALMILAAFRPRRQELSWRFHETAGRDYPHRYTALALDPLGEGESRELFSSLMAIDDLPENVRRLILERAEGNPFFVEEMIRSLLDAGLIVREDGRWRAIEEINSVSLPGTLAGVITARLDRLDEPTRRVVQTAAVIGRDFSYEVLSGVLAGVNALDDALLELQRREIVREKQRLPRRTYLFKHVLTQEAAYSSTLLSRRREIHLRTAEVLQQLEPDQAAVIARHFLDARQPARAAPYLVQAGDQAARAYSSTEAIEFYTKVLELRQEAGDRQLIRRAYEGLGAVLTLTNRIPDSVRNYEDMLRFAETVNDIPMQVSALNKLASLSALHMGQFQTAEGFIARSEQLARQHDESQGIAELAILRCQMCTAMADFDSVVKYMGEVAEIGKVTGVKEHLSMGLEHVASSLMFMTRFDEAWEEAHEALRVSREIGDREHEAWALATTIAICLVVRGDLDAARQTAQEGVEIAARIGALFPLAYGLWLMGEITRWRGDYEQALSYGKRSVEAALPLEEYSPYLIVQPLGSLGSVYLEISRHFADQVSRFHLHALKLLENPVGRVGGGTAWADVGFCAMALGDLETAGEAFQKGLNYPSLFMHIERPRHLCGSALLALKTGELDQALQLVLEAQAYAQERGMRHMLPFIALVTGKVRAARGELDQAVADLGRAVRLAEALQMQPVMWQAYAETARALSAAGQEEKAEAERQAAEKVIAEIASRFQDELLRENFLAGALAELGKTGSTGTVVIK